MSDLRARCRPVSKYVLGTTSLRYFQGFYRETLHWVLVSEPGFLLGVGPFPWKSNSFTRNEAQEQHSPLDTMLDYILYFEPPGTHL